MPRKSRAKPKTPEMIAVERAAERLKHRVQAFSAVGLPPEAAALVAHDDVQIVREGEARDAQKAAHDVARRLDVFDLVRESMEAGAYDAVRRLERDMLIRRGEGDKGRAMSRVDCEGRGDRTDEMVQAGQRVDAALALVGMRNAWLLTDLLDPSPASRFARPTWPMVVAYITGETVEEEQFAVVRMASANLADVYDRPTRRVAA